MNSGKISDLLRNRSFRTRLITGVILAALLVLTFVLGYTIMLCVIGAEKDTPFIGKSIRNSGFHETYGGFIIAVERNNLSVASPHIDIVIEEGDILWAIGDKNMADKLLEDGLMDEN